MDEISKFRRETAYILETGRRRSLEGILFLKPVTQEEITFSTPTFNHIFMMNPILHEQTRIFQHKHAKNCADPTSFFARVHVVNISAHWRRHNMRRETASLITFFRLPSRRNEWRRRVENNRLLLPPFVSFYMPECTLVLSVSDIGENGKN